MSDPVAGEEVMPRMTERNALTFADFREVSLDRAKHFPSAAQGWILAQWGNALAGEVGEACNIIKKTDRGDFTLDEARDDLADELADAFTYLDLLAANAGIDLEAAVIRKFNVVSERRGLPHKLPRVLSDGRYVLVPREEVVEALDRVTMADEPWHELHQLFNLFRRWLSTPSTTEGL